MNTNQYRVIVYVLFWAVRINGCVRRGRQPLLRGREWFFNVHVRPGFYEGAGRGILRRYWMRMLIPFAVDVPVAAAIFYSGRLPLLTVLILGLCALIHVNHVYSVDLAERQARPFAVHEDEQPVASVASSLAPRRLRDYMDRKMEWGLALATLGAFAVLIRHYLSAPEPRDWRLLLFPPIYFLYLQAGMLFVKRVVVAWRSPVPQHQAAEHLETREATRKYYLKVCDWSRAAAAAGFLYSAISLDAASADRTRLFAFFFGALLAISITVTIWVEIKRKQLVKMALRARPLKLPDFLNQSEIARWPLCFQPSAPLLVLKGPRGYSLNLANSLACIGAAYLAGFIALLALLPMGR